MWLNFKAKNKLLTMEKIWKFQQTFLNATEQSASDAFRLNMGSNDPRYKMYWTTEKAYKDSSH